MVEPHAFQFDGEGQNGDEFYEKIEAPQFVDLTAPDHYLPGDDQHWFCWRVGCNQKHEDEMDSEVIYNNFVLRVMAARSPNVLRKAFYRNNSSSRSLTCPQTVPAKLSKSKGGSKLAMISSISEKLNPKFKENPVLQRLCRTPDTKAKNGAVAKTLVFESPDRSARAKTPLKLTAPIKALCVGMKKLNMNARSREVKSRVFNALNIENPKGKRSKQDEDDGGNLNSMANCKENDQTAKISQVNPESILEKSTLVRTMMECDGGKHADAYDDDKENMQPRVNNLEKKVVRKRPIESSHKITRTTSKPSTRVVVGDGEAAKHRKLKLTDPKPFRLRTNERGILKEANLDKKLHLMRDISMVAGKIQNGASKLKGLREKEASHKPSVASRKHKASSQPDDSLHRGIREPEKNTKRMKQSSTKQLHETGGANAGASLKAQSSLLGATRQARSNASQPSSTSPSARCFLLQAKRSAASSKEPFFSAMPAPSIGRRSSTRSAKLRLAPPNHGLAALD